MVFRLKPDLDPRLTFFEQPFENNRSLQKKVWTERRENILLFLSEGEYIDILSVKCMTR